MFKQNSSNEIKFERKLRYFLITLLVITKFEHDCRTILSNEIKFEQIFEQMFWPHCMLSAFRLCSWFSFRLRRSKVRILLSIRRWRETVTRNQNAFIGLLNCLFACLSICLFVCLFIYLVSLLVYMFVCLFICVFIRLLNCKEI